MSGADWTIILVILVSALQAASAGFFQEAFGIAGLVCGYLLAAWQYHRFADHFAPYINSPWLGDIAGFFVIFFAVMVLAGIAGRITHWIMKTAGLSFIDRLFGAALGVVRGALVVAVVLMAMTSFTPTSKWLDNSELAPYFLVTGRAAIWIAPSDLRARFYQGLNFLHQEHERSGGQGR
jgi:membrane protein required for colicin V production